MKPSKAQTIILFDMIEEHMDDDSQDVIKLLHGSLAISYNQGYIDALNFVRKVKKC